MGLGMSCIGVVVFLVALEGIIYALLKKNRKLQAIFCVLFLFVLCG